MTTKPTNGFWLKVVGGPLLVIALVSGVALAWGLHGRVTRNETCLEMMTGRLGRIEGKLDAALERLPGR